MKFITHHPWVCFLHSTYKHRGSWSRIDHAGLYSREGRLRVPVQIHKAWLSFLKKNARRLTGQKESQNQSQMTFHTRWTWILFLKIILKQTQKWEQQGAQTLHPILVRKIKSLRHQNFICLRYSLCHSLSTCPLASCTFKKSSSLVQWSVRLCYFQVLPESFLIPMLKLQTSVLETSLYRLLQLLPVLEMFCSWSFFSGSSSASFSRDSRTLSLKRPLLPCHS